MEATHSCSHVMSAEETVGKMFVLAEFGGTTVGPRRQRPLRGPIVSSFSSSSQSSGAEERKIATFYLAEPETNLHRTYEKPCGGRSSCSCLPYTYNT